jgi:hypothetical protein
MVRKSWMPRHGRSPCRQAELRSVPPRSRCRSPLADEPSRTHRMAHMQRRSSYGRTGELRFAPAAFARKRAPTAGGRAVGTHRIPAVGVRLRTNLLRLLLCPPGSLASELLRGATERFDARCVRAVGVRLRTNLPEPIEWLTHSGQCTWMCRCREAQGCARAALPANGQGSQGSAGQPRISGKA